MEKIAAAVNSHDAAALKAMFSTRALEKASEIDAGLDYFLSFFPKGGLTWSSGTVNSEGQDTDGKKTELLHALYKVSADGDDFWVTFADFTVNDVTDPDNVGLYGLGVTPWAEDTHSDPTEPFFYWAGRIHYDESNPDGYPGVYVGYDNEQLSLHKMADIVQKLNIADPLGLADMFTEYVRADHATEIDNDHLDKLFALFPEGDTVWQEDQEVAPVVRERSDSGGKTTLLLSTYRVTSGGVDYWLSFAYFTHNATNPSNGGLYAIGVAPRTESGDSAAEQALFSWLDSFDVEATTPPGIYVPQ